MTRENQLFLFCILGACLLLVFLIINGCSGHVTYSESATEDYWGNYFTNYNFQPADGRSLPDSLYLWLPLEGNIDDYSNYRHYTSCSNCPEPVDGLIRDAYMFERSGNEIDLGNLDIEGNKLTISAWIWIEDMQGCGERIISKATGNNERDHYWMISLCDGGLRFRLKTEESGTKTLNAGSVETERWIHVTATYDGSSMRLYKYANEVGSIEQTGLIATNDSAPAYIGTNPNEYFPFNGKIDEVRIYTKALTSDEIYDVMRDIETIDAPPPLVPLNFKAQASSSSEIKLTWNLNENPVEGFRIARSTGAPFFTLLQTLEDGDLRSFTDTDLQPDTTYSYVIQSFIGEHYSEFSEAVPATTLSSGGPACDDSDGDGFFVPDSPECGTFDCDDSNADINPDADEICFNDIDDNCNNIVDENCTEPPPPPPDAPVITSVDSALSLSHGAVVNIHGEDFGVKRVSAPELPGGYVNVEPIVWDDASGSNPSTKWDFTYPNHNDTDWQMDYRSPDQVKKANGIVGGVTPPHNHTGRYLSGAHYEPEGGGDYSSGYNVCGGKTYQEQWEYTYISYYLRFDPSWYYHYASEHPDWTDTTLFDNNFKEYDYGQGTDIYGSPSYCSMKRITDPTLTWSCVYTNTMDQIVYGYNDEIMNHYTGPGYSTYFSNVPVARPQEDWKKIEFIMKHNSRDGVWTVVHDNVKVWELFLDDDNKTFTSNARTEIVFGGFAREAGDAEVYKNNWRYYTDIYYDHSWARVIIANSNNYESATIIENQLPQNTWNTNNIEIKVNQGRLPSNQDLYLYVFSKEGVRSAGRLVKFQ